MSTHKKITNKNELKKELGRLFKGISADCKKCEYIDCRGYVWLHPEEIREISKKVNTAIINRDIVFIDSFVRENNKINPEKLQPPCYLRDSCGKCSIQEIKPIICMLYPLNLRKIKNNIWLVLNKDCLFVDNLKKKKSLKNFKKNVLRLWKKLDKQFVDDLVETFKRFESISNYPKDYNKEVIKILRLF